MKETIFSRVVEDNECIKIYNIYADIKLFSSKEIIVITYESKLQEKYSQKEIKFLGITWQKSISLIRSKRFIDGEIYFDKESVYPLKEGIEKIIQKDILYHLYVNKLIDNFEFENIKLYKDVISKLRG